MSRENERAQPSSKSNASIDRSQANEASQDEAILAMKSAIAEKDDSPDDC